MVCLVMKIKKIVEVSTYFTYQFFLCITQLFIQVQQNGGGVSLYSLCYMLFSSTADPSHHQGELNTRENKLYTCVPDSFVLYLVVADV
jgi:hypothetical protein